MIIAYHYYFRKSDNDKNTNQKRYDDTTKKRTGSELKPLIDSNLDLKDE